MQYTSLQSTPCEDERLIDLGMSGGFSGARHNRIVLFLGYRTGQLRRQHWPIFLAGSIQGLSVSAMSAPKYFTLHTPTPA